MGRTPRIVVLVLTATLAAAFNLRLGAQTTAQSGTTRRLVLPGGKTTGLPASYWSAALANGGPMPRFERLLVIGRDGAILGEASGDDKRVLLPEALYEPLTTGTLRATLVHNHPEGTSLSGSDLAHLGKVGVDRVIAVGHDGSVFEASAGPRFDRATFERSVYPGALKHATDRLAIEARREGVPPVRLSSHLFHMVAVILDRAGVIEYRMTPSIGLWTDLKDYQAVVEWVIRSPYRL